MATEDTAPIPLHTTVARPSVRTVAALFAGGALLIASTFPDLAIVPLPTDSGGFRLAITAWGMDLGLGHSIQQYVGVVTLIVGLALIAVAAASLRAEFRWTRNASLIAGGLGVGAGLQLAAAGYGTGTVLAQLASASGEQITASIGPGMVIALLGAVASLLAIAFPPRQDLVPVEEPVVVERLEDNDEVLDEE
ncbi:hypothetical protein [Kutzneria sp. CA-103260]|uniref:hypothetical protein n=1 Tax=Kutzneria sp. CA-103260 TaxID=2802641 RepID=UPI001BA854ED|nr:hypothetical protein [Kutzneria sp. CA-103260]QUQ63435.1 hypothetical protein JJ691_11470 [Kutzneria sp. CA-103260]